MKRSRSRWEATLEMQLRVVGLRPEVEWVFSPGRRWRFDFAWPSVLVACEVEGGIFTSGRHTRGSGFVKDLEKYNSAALLAWLVLRVSPEMVESGEAVRLIQLALQLRRSAA